MANDRIGTCRVCRKPGVKLTFEHIPPRSSFNDMPQETFGLMDWLKREGEPMEKGKIQQRGAGEWSLCEPCNNNTGAWYVRELGKATAAGVKLINQHGLMDLDDDPEEHVVNVKFSGNTSRPRPLLLAKQIITMLLAISPEEMSEKNPELGDFVLDRELSGLPEKFQLYMALFPGPMARTVGGAARIGVGTGRIDVISEIAYPPFAYALTIDSPPEALRVGNITPFAGVTFEQEADLDLDLIVGFGHTPYPLDYRSRAALDRDREAAGGDPDSPDDPTGIVLLN
jgi:hypothetical protein